MITRQEELLNYVVNLNKNVGVIKEQKQNETESLAVDA